MTYSNSTTCPVCSPSTNLGALLRKKSRLLARPEFLALIEKRTPTLAKKIAPWLAREGTRIALELSSSIASNKVDLGVLLGKAAKKTPKQLVDKLDLSGWDALAGIITDDTYDVFRSAYEDGLDVYGQTDLGVTSQMDDRALQWAQQRSAELVGRKIDEDGNIIDNPDAKWSITNSTRDMLQRTISSAVKTGDSPRQLQQRIEDSVAFGDTRASAIARTELATAHIQGNKEGWTGAGVEQKRSALGSEHDIDDECDEAAEDGAIAMDELFSNGYDAPPYHPNCICDLLPVLVAEKMLKGAPIGNQNARKDKVTSKIKELQVDPNATAHTINPIEMVSASDEEEASRLESKYLDGELEASDVTIPIDDDLRSAQKTVETNRVIAIAGLDHLPMHGKPILVAHINGHDVIIDGNHRVVAAKLAGEKSIKVKYIDNENDKSYTNLSLLKDFTEADHPRNDHELDYPDADVEIRYEKAKAASNKSLTTLSLLKGNPNHDEKGRFAFGTSDPYVYHLSTSHDLQSFKLRGIKPSTGVQYAGPGVYMATTPKGTQYNTTLKEGTLFRIPKKALIEGNSIFHATNNPKGNIQYDEGTGEVRLTGGKSINPALLEVRTKDGWENILTIKTKKAHTALSLIKFTEGEHPRDDHGKFIPADLSNPEHVARMKQYNVTTGPTGYHDVMINTNPNAEKQFTMKDSKGRGQARYTAGHTADAKAEKFERERAFNEVAQKGIDGCLKTMADPNATQSQRDTAAATYLISQTGFRVGSDKDTGATKKAYGASNMLASHATVDGSKITFNFTGKKGVEQEHTIDNPTLAAYIKDRQDTGATRLFQTNENKVNAFFNKQVGNDFSIKDYRTWTGTTAALEHIATMPKPTTEKEYKTFRNQVGDYVAKKLGNTRTVALESYISPAAFYSWSLQ